MKSEVKIVLPPSESGLEIAELAHGTVFQLGNHGYSYGIRLFDGVIVLPDMDDEDGDKDIDVYSDLELEENIPALESFVVRPDLELHLAVRTKN